MKWGQPDQPPVRIVPSRLLKPLTLAALPSSSVWPGTWSCMTSCSNPLFRFPPGVNIGSVEDALGKVLEGRSMSIVEGKTEVCMSVS